MGAKLALGQDDRPLYDVPELADEYHPVAPDYPAYGFSSMPTVDEFDYSFDKIAAIMEKYRQY